MIRRPLPALVLGISFAFGWLAAGIVSVGAQSVLERQERGTVTDVAPKDPAMRTAFAKARATLPRFLKLIDAPPGHVGDLSVKLGFAGTGRQTEFIWIANPRRTSTGFSGIIGNRPNYVKDLSMGDPVTFTRKQIVDWSYRDLRTGRLVGNFTSCAVLMKEPRVDRQRFAEATGLHCE